RRREGQAVCDRGVIDPDHVDARLLPRYSGRTASIQREDTSTMKLSPTLLSLMALVAFGGSALAQDLGPRVKKLADGVYVHTGKGFESNSGIILTQEGVVVIDTGQNPIESRAIMDTVKKLTSMPVRFVIDTEPHADHTTGHY